MITAFLFCLLPILGVLAFALFTNLIVSQFKKLDDGKN